MLASLSCACRAFFGFSSFFLSFLAPEWVFSLFFVDLSRFLLLYSSFGLFIDCLGAAEDVVGELDLSKFPPLQHSQRIGKEIHDEVLLRLIWGGERFVDVGVELVWAPPRCNHCSSFGHLEETCCKKNTSNVSLSDQIDDERSNVAPGACDEGHRNGSDVDTEGGVQGQIDVGCDVVGPRVVGNGFQANAEACSSGLLTAERPVVLDNTEGVEQDVALSPRKATGGVVELLNQLKPKARGQGGKGAKVKVIIRDRNGRRLETYEDISQEFVQFFTDLLGSFDENVEVIHDDLLREILDVEITADMQSCLVAPVTQKEIKDVVFSMNGNKAPRLDGYSTRFFQATW
ncbi:hypothetical protein V6N11_079988 [Hibiscus sabdariffa]|uniref:Uncharacterized protein n=1 Tax=Hibiscus sabdariffa TaxID=183260 RepID=A0ABR2RXS2_9ROSI